MKGKISATAAVIFAALTAGCSANRAEEPFDGVMRVVVNVDCDEAYGIWTEYLLGGELLGGRDVQYADGGEIERGDQLVLKFTEEDFPNAEDVPEKTFGIYFRVYGANGELLRPDIPEKWQNASESYDGTHYTLSTGEYEDGTAAEPLWEWQAESGGVYEFRLAENGDGFYLFPMR